MQKRFNVLCFFLISVGLVLIGCRNTQQEVGAEPTPTAVVEVQATREPDAPPEKTAIIPVLNAAITGEQNLLWCATLQMAWDELSALAQGPIVMENEDPLVAQLNQGRGMPTALDDDGYLSKAGFLDDALIADLQRLFRERFPDRPMLAELQELPQHKMVAFAYLFKRLPFAAAFTRFTTPLNYQENEVAAFGLAQYMPGHPTDDLLARQVQILDYHDADNFIVELRPQAQADRIILAKLPPSETIEATLAGVRTRLIHAQPSALQKLETLMIPIIDLDVTRRFPELCGRKIQAQNQKLNGSALDMVTQQVQFRLDETGAVLESKAIFVSALPPRKFVFDKPFLLILQRRDAAMPYLVIWVNNPDLMVPFNS